MVCLLHDLDAPDQDEMNLSDKDWERLDRKLKKFSEETLEEVAVRIKDAIHPPSSLRRWLKEWGTAGAAITGAIALVALAVTGIVFATSEGNKNSEFRGTAIQHFANIDAAILEIKTRRTADTPADPGSQKAATELLAEVTKGTVKIPEEAVKEAGRSFVAAAPENEGAWSVALNYAAYRTKLNETLVGGDWGSPRGIDDFGFIGLIPYIAPAWPLVGGPRPAIFLRGPLLPIDRAYYFFEMGTDPRKLPRPEAPRDIRLDNIVTKLDGYYMRNVWLINSVVQYDGGPLRMDNVTFINCRFVMKNLPPTRTLVSSVLSKQAITAEIN